MAKITLPQCRDPAAEADDDASTFGAGSIAAEPAILAGASPPGAPTFAPASRIAWAGAHDIMPFRVTDAFNEAHVLRNAAT